MKVVILCGGKGTRLGFETKIIPKPMTKIDNDPIILHIIDYYRKFGYTLEYSTEFMCKNLTIITFLKNYLKLMYFIIKLWIKYYVY